MDFTQENFAVDFNEDTKVVEIQYQGVNALALASLQAQFTVLQGSINSTLSGVNGSIGTLNTNYGSLSTLITVLGADVSAEQAARLNGDTLLGADLVAYNNARIADIQAETSARGAALLAEAAARGAAIISATATIITDVANLASTVQGIASSLGGANASIILVQDALSTEVAARAAQYSTILANYNNTNAAITAEAVARADGEASLASQISALQGSIGTQIFYQAAEPSSGMVAGDVWYDTDDGNKPYRYTGTAWVDVTDVRIINNAAAIVSEAALRVAADNVNAGNITTVSGSLSTETSNRIAGDTTLDNRITTEKSLLQGLITDEATLRINADGVNASNISTVSASVTTETNNRISGDNTLQSNINTVSASVTTEANARIAADGTITAKYGVKVNANGHVAGFGLIANSNTFGVGDSEFVMDATRVKIYNGASAVAPFSVVGGVVRMANVVIGNAVIENLAITTGKIGNNAVSTTVASTVGSTSNTNFTQNAWQSITNVAFSGDSTNSRTIVISISVDATVSGAAASFISARIRRDNQGTITTLWEGLSDAGVATYKTYAQIKGTFTITNTPPLNAYANYYSMEIYGSGGTSAYYRTSTIVGTEFRK